MPNATNNVVPNPDFNAQENLGAVANQPEEAVEDTSYLDRKFATTLLPIKEREEQKNGTVKTVHKGNATYGFITLHDVNEGLPAPDSLEEVKLDDGAISIDPVYDDERLNWIQQCISQRVRSIAAGKIKQGQEPAFTWRSVLEGSIGPKFMTLMKEARSLFNGWLEEATNLPPEAVTQLSSDYFAGETLKGANPEIKAKVAEYVTQFEAALDEDQKRTYAKVLNLVHKDIAYDPREVMF